MRQLLFFYIFFAVACSQREINPTSDACNTFAEAKIEQDTSFVSTPLVISQKLLEDKINDAIKQVVIRDDDFNNIDILTGKKDRLKILVTRLGAIQITWKNDRATCSIPLAIVVKRQLIAQNIAPKALNVDIEFDLVVTFALKLDIDPNWHLNPKTAFVGLKWLKEPTAFGGRINLKKLIQRKLLERMPSIAASIDKKIHEQVHLDQAIGRVWVKIQKPIPLNKERRMVWLQFQPIQFEVGSIRAKGTDILIESRLTSFIKTHIGDNPSYVIDSVLPPLRRTGHLPDTASIHLLAEISYHDLNRLLAKRVSGQTFDVQGHKITIGQAKVSGCGEQLLVYLKLKGDFKGSVYLRGTPEYRRDSHLVIRNFDFDVNTEETLVLSADWLLHSTFKEEIQKSLALPLQEKIDGIPQKIMQGIEKGKDGKKLELDIEAWDFMPQRIWVQKDHLKILINTIAQVRFELEKL